MNNDGLIKKLKQIIDNLIFEDNKTYTIYLKFVGEEKYILLDSNDSLDLENKIVIFKKYDIYYERDGGIFREYDSLCYKNLNNLDSFVVKVL